MMKDYLLLFRGGLDFTKAPAEQVQEVIMKWRHWVDELTIKGIYNGGERLTRNEAAIGLQQAIEISKDCPIFNFDGKVEIREIAK